MGTLFVFIECALYGFGLIIIPGTLLATLCLMIINNYCKSNFGESLFKRGDV